MASNLEITRSSLTKTSCQVILLISILTSCLVLVFIIGRNDSSKLVADEVKVEEFGDKETARVDSHSSKPKTPTKPKKVHGKHKMTKPKDDILTTSTAKKIETPKSHTEEKFVPGRTKYKFGQRDVYLEGENRANYPVKTLPPGHVQDFKALRAECRKSGKEFEDPEFNPNGQANIIGNVDLLTSGDYPKWNKKFIWKRPKKINKNVVFTKVEADGKRYKLSDIKQGSLGDCYYLSALGLVTTYERLINFVIPQDNNEEPSCGIFHFRFWIRGYYFDIVVDDRLPYIDRNGNGKKFHLAFTEMSGDEISPIWNTVPPEKKARLNIVEDEGEFWISAESATHNPEVFDRGYSCFWFNDLDQVTDGGPELPRGFEWNELHGTWEGRGTQDPKDWDGLANKPQYLAEMTSSRGYPVSIVLVSLMYKDYLNRRDSIPSLETRIYNITDKSLLGQKPPFPASAFKSGKLKRVPLLPTVKIAKSREYCTGERLPVGTYVIMPMLTKAKVGEGGDYYLRVIGEAKITASSS